MYPRCNIGPLLYQSNKTHTAKTSSVH